MSSNKRGGRHRKKAARHRKETTRNRQRAARNGILVAAVGVGLAVAGQGVASATTDAGTSDSAAKASSSADAGTASKAPGKTATAGPARKRPPAKQSAATPRASSVTSPKTATAVSAPTTADATITASTTTADQTPTATPSETGTLETVETTAGPQPAAKSTTAAAKPVVAADAPAPGTGAWYFIGTLQRAVQRLAGWPGLPHNFVTITNHLTDQNLDTLDDQLDALIANAVANSPARWVPDLSSILGLFVKPAIPSYTFSDTLNAWGDFLNRIVPPFSISPGAGTFGVITQYKIMGAAVVGTATVLTDMLNGVYDPAQWEIDVIKATTGADVTRSDLTNSTTLETKIAAAQAAAILTLGLTDGGAYYDPTRAWDITLPTWTAAQVNPFTVVAYVALVAMYKRFQEVAVLTTFTTSTTYDSWLYTLSLGGDSTRSEYAAGTFHAVDPDGRSVTFSSGATYTSTGGALVTVNTSDGGFTYTNTLPGKAFFHRATSLNEADRYDTVNIPVTSADGAGYTLTFKVQIIDGSNAAPTVSSSVGAADGLGVVRGTVTGSDSDGDTLTYSLVGSSVNGLTNNSAYTKSGSGNGGIVTINPTTGAITYISSATASSSQSFQVQVADGHGGTAVTTVTVPNATSITPSNLNTSTLNVVTGSVPVPSGDAGLFTGYSLGTGPTKGSVTINPTTGAFTYTRNSSLGHTGGLSDSFTVIATDTNGRTVTLSVPVTPTVADNVPVVVSATTDAGNGSSARWGLNTSTWTQTTTGKITATDADGDTLSYSLVDATTHAPVSTTTNGGTVTFNGDGSYTYSITKNQAYFHGAAKIGASGAALNDTFTVAVSDGYGGIAYTTITMPIYAVNSAPAISGYGGPTCAFFLCTRGFMTVSDPDGDSIPNTAVTAGTGAGYSLDNGSVTGWGSGVTTISWPAGGTFGTTATANTFTVYDGFYTVTNGVANIGTPAKFWVQWAANSGDTTTGN